MPGFGFAPASSLIDEKNIRTDFKSKTDGFAFPTPQSRWQIRVQLTHFRRLKPCGERGCPCPHLGRSLGVQQFGQNRAGNQNDAAVDISKHIGTAEADEIVERAVSATTIIPAMPRGYSAFVVTSRSKVVMSFSRSSTV